MRKISPPCGTVRVGAGMWKAGGKGLTAGVGHRPGRGPGRGGWPRLGAFGLELGSLGPQLPEVGTPGWQAHLPHGALSHFAFPCL